MVMKISVFAVLIVLGSVHVQAKGHYWTWLELHQITVEGTSLVDVVIDKPTSLDNSDNPLAYMCNSIIVQDGGKLIFNERADDINLKVKNYIIIEKGGELKIGDKKAPHQGSVKITVTGTDGAEAPYIAVNKGEWLGLNGLFTSSVKDVGNSGSEYPVILFEHIKKLPNFNGVHAISLEIPDRIIELTQQETRTSHFNELESFFQDLSDDEVRILVAQGQFADEDKPAISKLLGMSDIGDSVNTVKIMKGKTSSTTVQNGRERLDSASHGMSFLIDSVISPDGESSVVVHVMTSADVNKWDVVTANAFVDAVPFGDMIHRGENVCDDTYHWIIGGSDVSRYIKN